MSRLANLCAALLVCSSTASAATFTTYTDRATFEAALDSFTVDPLDRPADIDFNGVTGDLGDYLVTADPVDTRTNLLDVSPFLESGRVIDGATLKFFLSMSGATISFDNPIFGFGFDQFAWGNQAAGGPTTLNILGSSFLGDLSGTAEEAGFFGVIADEAFTLITIETDVPNDGFSLDNITYGRTATIPLPAGLPLLLGAAGSLALLRMRRARTL